MIPKKKKGGGGGCDREVAGPGTTGSALLAAVQVSTACLRPRPLPSFGMGPPFGKNRRLFFTVTCPVLIYSIALGHSRSLWPGQVQNAQPLKRRRGRKKAAASGGRVE